MASIQTSAKVVGSRLLTEPPGKHKFSRGGLVDPDARLSRAPLSHWLRRL